MPSPAVRATLLRMPARGTTLLLSPAIHLAIVTATWLAAALTSTATAAEPAEFGRDVYPILRRACFDCHGPQKQEAELRLDQRQFALQDPAIISPHNSAGSELVRRIGLPADDPEVMPNRGALLTAAEVGKIKTWIEAGAVWPEQLQLAKHWAYEPPQSTVPVALPTSAYELRNPIDAWVLQRLGQEGLSFSEPADRTTLIRRLALDLTGLPPSPVEVEDFEQDESPDAYERLLDRLLASPQYGVRWARPWLDYARYADSHGFQRDDLRDLWPYRDWVVNALNADMPFSQFAIEQIAGDLLPEATEAQRIATGFNRSAPTNVEAGSDPEETRVNQVHDRVQTLGLVWLGTTLECAQCHDHKYDPFTQRDYYGLFAFFNHTALEADRTNPQVPGSIQFRGPTLELTDAKLEAQRKELQGRLAQVNTAIDELKQSASQGLAAWETELKKRAQPAAEHVATVVDFSSSGGATHEILTDQSVLISGEPAPDKDTYSVTVRTTQRNIRAIKLETLTDDSLPGRGPGRGDAQRPNFVLNNLTATAAPATEPDRPKPVKFAAARASFSQANLPVTNLLQANNPAKVGWAINPKFHEPHWAILETAEPIDLNGETLLTLKLEQHFGGARTIGRLRVSVITGDASQQSWPAELAAALALTQPQRSKDQQDRVLAFSLQENAEYRRAEQTKRQLETKLQALTPPSTLVMQEVAPRKSTIFQRGDFRTPGEAVEPATPPALHRMTTSSTAQPTRLDLARWLVDRNNPLVARVAVNRWWAELFGRGLVGTPEDFGLQGERPTHPELLDWLACEFRDHGWSPKRLLRTIAASAAYRQVSRITPPLLARDPRNEFYARGPRHRLEAELIRDNALAIAGLLNPELGGPPIRPYQPDGLWVKVGGQRYDYEVSPGDAKYRRGLYVVWKRAAPYPSFVSFDANNRMACRVQRPRSNTPLQALALMNDPVYVEAALAFARRVLNEQPDADDATRIRFAFRLAVGRWPRPAEQQTLGKLLIAERAARAADPAGTREFVGSFALPPDSAAAELAAWYAVAAALLNLDECISKG